MKALFSRGRRVEPLVRVLMHDDRANALGLPTLRRAGPGSTRRRLVRMYMMGKNMYMALRHKHLKIDQSKLDRAKRLLKLPTEQATIDRALDAVLAEQAIVEVHKKTRSVGGMIDAFGEDRVRRRAR